MAGEVRTWYETNSSAGTFSLTVRAAGGEQVRLTHLTGNAGYQGQWRWYATEQDQVNSRSSKEDVQMGTVIIGPSTNEGIIVTTGGNDAAAQRRGARGVKIS